jgi:phosphohistidine phosphatase
MRLIIIRHADAGDAEEWARTGNPDSQRPLSEKGREQFQRAAPGLMRLVPRVDLIASSPYTRALQTAELLPDGFAERSARAVTDSLVPDAPLADFVQWLRAQGSAEIVAAVGHEPHLSTMATWLIAGVEESRLKLKKGGACLISFDKRPAGKKGTLHWLATPGQLRI